jgi:serine/threonine protein kinase
MIYNEGGPWREHGVMDDSDHSQKLLHDGSGAPEHSVTDASRERPGAPASQRPIEVGAVLAERYQIEAALGQGGSGTVFRAWDRVLGDPIAIKILRPDRARERSWIMRLAREVKVARAIRHPNVCRVFEVGQADGHWFITMELGMGTTLRTLFEQENSVEGAGARPLSDRLVDARAISAGLAAIHAVGIVHRDVTPQNVLRMDDGRLVISDFGLAVELAATTTMHGGTPNYMPPETLLGRRNDQRSDVWQLGLILHELFFGQRPVFEETAG